MGWKKFLISFLTFALIALIAIWFLFPYNIDNFILEEPTNFSISGNSVNNGQFYPNMRFPYKEISYRIDNDCSLQKKNDMERAFGILENLTILDFYPVSQEEEIFVHCSERIRKTDENLFVAGEGGPTSATTGSNFTIIFEGEVLLLRDVQCDFPNVPVHELLHVLGFNHSDNSHNIMYPTTSCGQVIGQDTLDLINEIYSAPSYADILFVNASARVHGRYLDLNVTVKNEGLVPSDSFFVKVFADSNEVKEIEVQPIEVGFGRNINFRNIGINAISIEEFRLVAETSFNELNKENNEILLVLKN